ncbi:MAG: hypothetical protein Q9M82_00895 [Mariprofundus sp.]|nr:hypothetical protein [Mariprofundus sp.]
MTTDFALAPWGMTFAALMFVIGNGVWTNNIVRHKPWLGWVLWSASAVIIIVIAAAIELRLSGSDSGIWTRLTSVNGENHWIVIMLYMLISVPGAAGVLFHQSVNWTRMAVLATALVVFIPLGKQLHDPNDSRLFLSLGITLAMCGLIWLWSVLLDCEPAHQRKTVPLAEMDE